MNMAGMFADASSFDASLCAWKSKLPTTLTVGVAGMFKGLKCINQSPENNNDGEWVGPFWSETCETIQDHQELHDAVQDYYSTGSEVLEVTDKYGDIEDWCVYPVEMFDRIFSPYDYTVPASTFLIEEFNVDLSSWDTSHIKAHDRIGDPACILSPLDTSLRNKRRTNARGTG
jgi:hypothetical protein